MIDLASKLRCAFVVLTASLVPYGCVEDEGPGTTDAGGGADGGGVDGSGGGGDGTITCDDATDFMEVVVSSAPKAPYMRITPGSYGANLFYMYEVIEDPNDPGNYLYATNDSSVETRIASKDWVVPDGKLWSAGRLQLDGLDPFAPSTDDWFIYPYLPFAKWKSSNDVVSDGQTCPGLQGADAYGRPRCIDKHQLDDGAPNLQDGHFYLARMVMNIGIAGAGPIACYQRIFPYTGGTYTRE